MKLKLSILIVFLSLVKINAQNSNLKKLDSIYNLSFVDTNKIDSHTISFLVGESTKNFELVIDSIDTFKKTFNPKEKKKYKLEQNKLKNSYLKYNSFMKRGLELWMLDDNLPDYMHQKIGDLLKGYQDENEGLPREIQNGLGYINLKTISEYYRRNKSIQKTLVLIESEKEKGEKSKYNIGEYQINSFGYELIKLNKNEEALSVFILNTKLYPNKFNTFDSLGECLLLLNKKQEGIEAYKKSLELNPENENAKKIISEMK